MQLLREIHRGGKYPYWKSTGGRAALWLRLEHNLLPNADELVAQARTEGIGIKVLGKAELSAVRPGDDLKKRGQDNPEIILVLFRLQMRKEMVQDARISESRELLSLLGAGPNSPGIPGGGGRGGGCRSAPRSPLLHRQDPEPLSVDEMLLWEIEQREDEEGGADVRNWETFGEDNGWTFEENLAANEWLADRAWQQGKLQRGGHPVEAVPGWDQCHYPRQRAHSSRSEAGAASEGSDNSNSKPHVAKFEIEQAISTVLEMIPTLHRPDFDGQVRQYLHAIRSKGGQPGVLDAIQVIRIAMVGKTRTSIRKWPAYLVTLLKRFLQEFRERQRSNADSERRRREGSAANAWLEGVYETNGESGHDHSSGEPEGTADGASSAPGQAAQETACNEGTSCGMAGSLAK